MKKIYILFSLLLFTGLAYGKHVDENTAKETGQAFLHTMTNSPALKSAVSLQLVYKANSESGNPLATEQPSVYFYVFNNTSDGFVIVAGDDNVLPILGYSDNSAFDPGNIPPNVAKWMEGYKSQIRYVSENNVPASREITGVWQGLKSGGINPEAKKSITAVNPLVEDNGNYKNLTEITVTNSNDIELNSALTVSPGTTLTQGSAASVTLNIVNDGTATFKGQYAVDLYYLDGSWAQSIGTIDENEGLPSGYTYISPFLTFSTSVVTVDPGTYLMAVQHNPNNTGWQLTGSTYFQNPVKVTVVAPNISPDIYEDNNSVNQSYNLTVSFSGNNASKNTSGSNIHLTSDNDFYKVVLPAGYKYTITARLHDSYNSGNGQTYTLDGLFSYSTDGSTWSEVYDDVMAGNIMLNTGGTVYFHIAPYFAGGTGTYLFDLGLTRAVNVGIPETEKAEFINVYPNPAKAYITIDLGDFTGKLYRVNMLDSRGKQVFSGNAAKKEKKWNLPLNEVSPGMYFIQLHTDTGVLTKKIIVEK